jgi:hypothetical protein
VDSYYDQYKSTLNDAGIRYGALNIRL